MPFHIGIDENGLGPRLGPLVVTAVLASVNDDASRRIDEEPQAFLHERLGDSKKLVSHTHTALGEAWARVLGPKNATTPWQLLEAMSLQSRRELQAPCPEKALAQCWAEGGHLSESDSLIEKVRHDLKKLDQAGVQVMGARCSITCVHRMNQARQASIGRLDLDLRSMESLIVAARESVNEEVVARCGKVGGLMRYLGKFALLSSYPAVILGESGSESAYRLAGLGRVHFLRDAEDRDPLIALASLVGKWVREVLMGQIVQFYRQSDEGLPNASGYNDPVTDRFVRDSLVLRQELGIADTCFLREGKSKE